MGPLAGIKVVELAGLGPTPFCGMMLSDFGASVVRIERPANGPLDFGPEIDRFQRGRMHLALDLKQETERDALLDLLASADVLLEGLRPGVAERLGLGPEPCLAANPRLVYARGTGWGQTGPLAHSVGHDLNYLAITGALDMIGPSGGRAVPPLTFIGDYGAGGMLMLAGVLAALRHAEATGEGQEVDAAIVDGVALMMNEIFTLQAVDMWRGERGGEIINGGAPYYNVYRCADGREISVACLEPAFYARFLELLELPAGEFEPQDARAQWPGRIERLAGLFAGAPRAHWLGLFDGEPVCVAPVHTLEEAQEDPQMRARRLYPDIDGNRHGAAAPRFSRSPATIQGTREVAGIEDVRKIWGERAS